MPKGMTFLDLFSESFSLSGLFSAEFALAWERRWAGKSDQHPSLLASLRLFYTSCLKAKSQIPSQHKPAQLRRCQRGLCDSHPLGLSSWRRGNSFEEFGCEFKRCLAGTARPCDGRDSPGAGARGPWAGSTYSTSLGEIRPLSPDPPLWFFLCFHSCPGTPGPSEPHHLLPLTRSLGPSLGAYMCVSVCHSFFFFSGVRCFIIILITVVLSFMLPLTFIFGLVMLFICL